MSLKKLAFKVFIEPHAEVYLFWLSYFALGWGILLFFNSYLLTVSDSYNTFESFALEPITWLLIYAGAGIFGLFSCITPSRQVIRLATMLMFLLWSFTVICFFSATGTVGTGSFVYASFAALSAWTFLRVGNKSFQTIWNG